MVARHFVNASLGPLLGAVLAGCASKPYSPLSSTLTSPEVLHPIHSASEVPPPISLPAPEVIVLPHEPAAVVGLDNIEAGLPAATVMTNLPAATIAPVFGTGWIPLRAWTDRCALGPPDRTVSGGATIYRVTTRGGVCKLTVGSRLAQWNGISVWLGFPPQLVRGEARIHALDAEKTLLPLAGMPLQPSTGTRTVVLDAGHGGGDGGTRGPRGELEKDYTLDWALRAERLLANAGWKVFLTRRTDVDVPLPERVSFADRVHADLFISLHFNSTFPQTQPSGIETYCLTPAGMPSTLARGYADDERAVFPNNAFDPANMDWAMRIHRSLLSETHAHDDGIKRARFMGVLRYQNRPAVLVEGGFLSNNVEARMIDSAAYREQLAAALAAALK